MTAYAATVDGLRAWLRARTPRALSTEFAAAGKCRVFREWWHSAESPG